MVRYNWNLLSALTGSNGNNPLGAFNKSDERFSQGGARRSWLTSEPNDAAELLGIDLSGGYSTDERGRETKVLNIANPSVGGQQLRLQVTETVEPTEWQAMNIQTAAKRRLGKDGDYITHQGMYIFANTSMVYGEQSTRSLRPMHLQQQVVSSLLITLLLRLVKSCRNFRDADKPSLF